MLLDLPLDQLETYCPQLNEPPDFDTFWTQTLAEARQHPLDVRYEPVDAGLKLIEVFDVTFRGYGGSQSRAGCCSRANARHRCPA